MHNRMESPEKKPTPEQVASFRAYLHLAITAEKAGQSKRLETLPGPRMGDYCRARPVHSVFAYRRSVLAAVFLVVLFTLVSSGPKLWADDVAANLPDGVKAVWDVTKAYHETTPTRASELEGREDRRDHRRLVRA